MANKTVMTIGGLAGFAGIIMVMIGLTGSTLLSIIPSSFGVWYPIFIAVTIIGVTTILIGTSIQADKMKDKS